MIPKKNRINKGLFIKVFKKNEIIYSPIFMFKYIITPRKKGAFSFIVPKSVEKKATKRNFLKRKGYNSLREIGIRNGIAGVFFYKKDSSSTKTKEIKESINLIFKNLE